MTIMYTNRWQGLLTWSQFKMWWSEKSWCHTQYKYSQKWLSGHCVRICPLYNMILPTTGITARWRLSVVSYIKIIGRIGRSLETSTSIFLNKKSWIKPAPRYTLRKKQSTWNRETLNKAMQKASQCGEVPKVCKTVANTLKALHYYSDKNSISI